MKHRRLRAALATLALLSLVLFPAAGALVQLGAGLSAIDRMHARAAAAPGAVDMVGSYEGDPAAAGGGVRFRPVRVKRP